MHPPLVGGGCMSSKFQIYCFSILIFQLLHGGKKFNPQFDPNFKNKFLDEWMKQSCNFHIKSFKLLDLVRDLFQWEKSMIELTIGNNSKQNNIPP